MGSAKVQLSPLLFIIAFDGLLESLAEVTEFPLGYADDVVVACKNTNQIRKAIKKIETFLADTGMKINVKKSALLSNYKQVLEVKKFKFDQEQIPIVDSYKYLGVFINAKLSFKEQLDFMLKNFKL